MTQFGFTPLAGSAGFYFPQQQQPAPANAAPSAAPAAAQSPAPVAAAPFALSPAYLSVLPQFAAPVGGFGYGAGASAAPQGSAGSGQHVTSNPTNALASSAAPNGLTGSGFTSGFAAVGVAAAPVVLLSPVFLAFGFPVVFQGSPAQPPVGNPPPPPVDQTPPPVDTPDTPDVPDVPTTPTPPADDGLPDVDVVPGGDDQASNGPRLPITELNAEDFARYRLREKSLQQETSVSLQLTTQDGDVISLEFSQLDSLDVSRFRGRTLEGARISDRSFKQDNERVVNTQVVGDLSAEESAAVDTVLSGIIDAVNSFFSGQVGDAVDKLQQLDFDGAQLAELSLNLSQTKSAEVTRAYRNGADALDQLRERDADVEQALEFIATEQKRLVDLAAEVFEAPSAARLVRSLVAPLLDEPFSQLQDKLLAAAESETSDNDVTESDDADD